MNIGELQLLVQFFKVMADENRLKMIGLLGSDERRVSDLAALLDLSEPTVSHHMSKLRKLGLVNLRVEGNNRYYRLNASMLRTLNQRTFDLENISFDIPSREAPDTAWIDALDLSDADRKVLKDYTIDGRLKQIPAKRKKLMAVLRWLSTQFEPDVKYSERQVNDILLRYHEDYAGLRRDLVDFGFLSRERGGSQYWRTPEDENE
jgi:biotin operon repressor